LAFSIHSRYYGKVSVESGLFRDAAIYEAGEYYLDIIPRLNMIQATAEQIAEEEYKEKKK
jgi:hypothetical protein